jgi:hypothetical protein
MAGMKTTVQRCRRRSGVARLLLNAKPHKNGCSAA